MSYTISGGFSTKDPKSMDKIIAAVESGKGKIGLPFVATGWKSDHNANLVTGKKAPVKEKEVKKEKLPEAKTMEVKEEKKIESLGTFKGKEIIKDGKSIIVPDKGEILKVEKIKKEVKKILKKKSGDTKGSDIRGSPLGVKKKTSKTWSKSRG